MLNKRKKYLVSIVCLSIFSVCIYEFNKGNITNDSNDNVVIQEEKLPIQEEKLPIQEDKLPIPTNQNENSNGKTTTQNKESNEENQDTKESDINELNIDKFFNNYEDAAFILANNKEDCLQVYNESFLDKRISPQSTFKILNSLIFLEENLIEDENTVIKWDGTTYSRENWNCDQSLKSAFQNSVVWVYSKLASKLPVIVQKEYLNKTNYGNCDCGDEVEYWLDASLKISLREQVNFIYNFYYNNFGFSDEHINIVKNIMKCYEDSEYTIYGKTGTGNGINLFVGYIEDIFDNVYFFATYVKKEDSENQAKPVTLDIIADMYNDK